MYIDHEALTSQYSQQNLYSAMSCAVGVVGVFLAFFTSWKLIPISKSFAWLGKVIIAVGTAIAVGCFVSLILQVVNEGSPLEEAIVHNLETKYDISEIELGPEPTWERSTVIDGKLSDGRRIVGGTVMLDDSGEPRLVGAVYDAEADDAPLRKGGGPAGVPEVGAM